MYGENYSEVVRVELKHIIANHTPQNIGVGKEISSKIRNVDITGMSLVLKSNITGRMGMNYEETI